MASSGGMPIGEQKDFLFWIEFINQHETFFTFASSMSFVIPVAVCLSYIYICPEKSVIKRVINIPIIFALFGSIGWLISFVWELIVLVYLQLGGYLNMYTILFSSAMNMSQICLFISTFAFLVLDVIHRKIILPKYFAGGQLNQYPGAIKLSSSGLITIFYLSVGIFPIVFLAYSLYCYSISHGFEISVGIFIVIAIIIIFGLAMTASFADHFSSPLRKLKEATEKIRDGKYDVNVDVVSSDDFGILADNFNDMAHSLDEKSKKIQAISDSIIKGMAIMVEQRDNSTGGHISRTSDCVKVFMDHLIKNDEYDFSPEFYKAIIKAAPMHDLGKIAVEDAVLRKNGRFEDWEYAIMKTHAAAGKVMVERVLGEVDDELFKNIAVNVAHYHHEKWNGTGYPNGLAGEDIPIEARIMAFADVFDALVSKRCYKDSMSYDKAFEIIEKDMGSHFDPKLGKIFIECRPDLEALYDGYDKE